MRLLGQNWGTRVNEFSISRCSQSCTALNGWGFVRCTIPVCSRRPYLHIYLLVTARACLLRATIMCYRHNMQCFQQTGRLIELRHASTRKVRGIIRAALFSQLCILSVTELTHFGERHCRFNSVDSACALIFCRTLSLYRCKLSRGSLEFSAIASMLFLISSTFLSRKMVFDMMLPAHLWRLMHFFNAMYSIQTLRQSVRQSVLHLHS